MKEYEIKINYTGYLYAKADNLEQAIEKAIERTRDNYGSEIADYADFTLESVSE